MTGLRQAFKEWAVICQALAEGRQAIILRKGGIAEHGGEFQVQHTRFWLYPTFVHEKSQGLRPEAEEFLKKVETNGALPGHVRLSHFVEVDGVYHLHDIASAFKLEALHIWSRETVQSRFLYRTPGLYVLPARVFHVPNAIELPETLAFAGCKTWVDLGKEFSTARAKPVLSDAAFYEVQRQLEAILQPTGLA